MLAYEADTAWNRGITCIFFKILIQLYFLCSYIYSLTYCIKEVIKCKIFWRLNKKMCRSMRRLRPETGESLTIFSKHWSNCICYIYFYIFYLLYQRGYQGQYFWTLNLKVLAYEAATAWNRGILCKILKFLIKLYLFCLLNHSST